MKDILAVCTTLCLEMLHIYDPIFWLVCTGMIASGISHWEVLKLLLACRWSTAVAERDRQRERESQRVHGNAKKAWGRWRQAKWWSVDGSHFKLRSFICQHMESTVQMRENTLLRWWPYLQLKPSIKQSNSHSFLERNIKKISFRKWLYAPRWVKQTIIWNYCELNAASSQYPLF